MDPDYGVAAPTYVGSNGNGTHVIIGPDGQLQTVTTHQLPDSVLPQAVQSVGLPPLQQNPDGGPQLFGASSAQLQRVHEALNSQPVSAQQTAAVNQLTDGPYRTPDQVEPDEAAPITPAPPAPAAGPQPGPSTPLPAIPAGGGGGAGIGEIKHGEQDALQAAKIQHDISNETVPQQQALDQNYAQRAGGYVNAEQQRQQMQDSINQKMMAIADKTVNSPLSLPHHTFGQQLLSGLGVILGGIGSGMQGRENPVIGQLQEKTNQYLENQKYNISQGKTADDMYQQVYNNVKQTGIDAPNAFKATDAIVKQKFLGDMDQVALAHGNQAGAQQWYQVSGAARQAAGKELADATLQGAQSAAQFANARATNVNTQGAELQLGLQRDLVDARKDLGNGVSLKDLQVKAPNRYNALLRDAYTNKTFVPGIGIAATPPSEDEQKQLGAAYKGRLALQTLDKLASNPANAVDLKAHGEAELAVGEVRNYLKQALGAGGNAFSPREQETMERLTSDDPTKIFTEWKGRSAGLHRAFRHAIQGVIHDRQITEFNPDRETPAS